LKLELVEIYARHVQEHTDPTKEELVKVNEYNQINGEYLRQKYALTMKGELTKEIKDFTPSKSMAHHTDKSMSSHHSLH